MQLSSPASHQAPLLRDDTSKRRLCEAQGVQMRCPAMALAGPQVIIMTTPIAHFFRCAHQDGFMWLFAVGVGAGSLLVSFLTKVLTRCAVLPCTIRLMGTAVQELLATLLPCMPASGKGRRKQRVMFIILEFDNMLPASCSCCCF